WNVGVGFAVGAKQSGLTLDMGANHGKGNTDGIDVTQVNTHVTAGKTATINSGGDTDMRGAVVTAPAVTGKIEGNLLVESVQDTSTYTNKQSSSGFGVSLCVPPLCVGDPGLQSANVSGGKTNTTSTYASVAEQSRIRAGDGGFQIAVKGDTVLNGGAVTSTQKAVGDGKNSFVHGGAIITSDIQNSASYDAKGYSVSAGMGSGYDKSGQANPSGSFGVGQASGSAGSVTQAAISGIAGNKDARTGDARTKIAPIFDKDKVCDAADSRATHQWHLVHSCPDRRAESRAQVS
ncbi:MAG: hemagglutinin repeat-containing protein, partial [Burkholderiaceae bacterium]|nr:hemagglutinin repeat-containing protein [Burkholderiaceae bacterium]